MKKSLADELDRGFEDVSLSPTGIFGGTESRKASREEIAKNTTRFEGMVPEDGEQHLATQSHSSFPAMADTDLDSPATFVIDDERSPTAHTQNTTALSRPPRKSKFIEHCSPVESTAQPKSFTEHPILVASKHNRELIARNTDGFFNMEIMPTATDVQRHIQQSKGIAALQRTLVPVKIPNVAPFRSGSSHDSSSRAADSVRRPSTLRQVTFAEPQGRRMINRVQGPYPIAISRPQAGSRFSLARDLVVAGHRKKLPEPSAPARFVKLPTDPVVHFKRNFGEFGLKITIPEPDSDEDEEGDPGSITSVPDVDTAGNLKLKQDKYTASEVGNGITRVFNPNQCLEKLCPIRWAHAKGPYHHLGDRHNKIMTGLFGHSNPPPEIWNAYRNMLHLTDDGGVVLSPDRRPGSKEDEDLVIAFAMFHFGELNGISGEEFHRRYAGRHMSSRVAPQLSDTKSSNWSCGSCLGSWK